MAHSVTLGGDRLGSGNKNKIAMHDYERSTHNLSQKFTSSLQVGTLYPFLVIPAMRGDKFTIDLAADARTIPTKGPLFGSFKMQVDLFQCDVRLYQAVLHNNPLSIGLKMNRVAFPKLCIHDGKPLHAFSNTSLMKYLGLSGIGGSTNAQYNVSRQINAIPALAYYEIFKTYYSNKQEENAYVIGTERAEGDVEDISFDITGAGEIALPGQVVENSTAVFYTIPYDYRPLTITFNLNQIPHKTNEWQKKVWCMFYDENDTYVGGISIYNGKTSIPQHVKQISENQFVIQNYDGVSWGSRLEVRQMKICWMSWEGSEYTEYFQGLQPFALANIDDMRLKLLSDHVLGRPFKIENTETDATGVWDKASGTDQTGLPYVNLVDMDNVEGQTAGITKNATSMNGLVVKTYQSDIFNNWINTEWIDGENGIAEITAIAVNDGKIKVDSINLSEKLYNMLNRIAVSDGSYEGWQDAVYTDTPRRHIESPIYLGGMSSEIIFEEIVQTSAGTEDSPLGNLGGKGKLIKNKGGHVTVKCSEACFIIGIVSLTPRINYCQGNEWYLTDLKTMDDFHKPALDGIGFQDLIAEQMAWWDTIVKTTGEHERHSIGKIPAWMHYMTAVDKCYGDFAETEGRGFMTLLRDYTRDTTDNTIQDATTYIDPRKFNYAFAVNDIDAQNFWVQIYSKVIARRLMSAKQIPNI